MGAHVGRPVTSPLRIVKDGGGSPLFPPLDHAWVKALAWERGAETKQPLSRQSLGALATRAQTPLGPSISRSTVCRIRAQDGIKPGHYRYGIFPGDPLLALKAGPIWDRYEGLWQDQPLGLKDSILGADEKTRIQARIRGHPSRAPGPGPPMRLEHESERGGALQYLAAWEVRRGFVMGRCEEKTGIPSFGRLVDQVRSQEPYRSGDRIFWIGDNGSSHRGEAARRRLVQSASRLILVQTPVPASWLNQVEISFSIVQRKVLTPNDFWDLGAVGLRWAWYEELSNRNPTPFQWNFNRAKLMALLTKIQAREQAREQLLAGQPIPLG